jgi:predicted small integral membrane protein
MKARKALIGVVALLSLNAVASDMRHATIQKMMVDTTHGDRLFIRATGTAGSFPGCSTNGSWQYVLPLDTELKKDTMMSLILTAYVAGKEVRLIGKDLCDSFSTIETLRRIEFESPL